MSSAARSTGGPARAASDLVHRTPLLARHGDVGRPGSVAVHRGPVPWTGRATDDTGSARVEQLNTYGRPFYQGGTEMVVPPLTPYDVAGMLELGPAHAFDAYLVSGGLPLILEEWPRGAGLWDYLDHALRRPTSALLVSGERALAAEFPTEAQAAPCSAPSAMVNAPSP